MACSGWDQGGCRLPIGQGFVTGCKVQGSLVGSVCFIDETASAEQSAELAKSANGAVTIGIH